MNWEKDILFKSYHHKGKKGSSSTGASAAVARELMLMELPGWPLALEPVLRLRLDMQLAVAVAVAVELA